MIDLLGQRTRQTPSNERRSPQPKAFAIVPVAQRISCFAAWATHSRSDPKAAANTAVPALSNSAIRRITFSTSSSGAAASCCPQYARRNPRANYTESVKRCPVPITATTAIRQEFYFCHRPSLHIARLPYCSRHTPCDGFRTRSVRPIFAQPAELSGFRPA